MKKTVDTEEFWQAMCKSGFVRTSLNEGWCGNTRYCTDTPPEQVDGFLEEKIKEITKNLGSPSVNSSAEKWHRA